MEEIIQDLVVRRGLGTSQRIYTAERCLGFFMILPVLGTLFVKCPFSVFKEIVNLWRYLKYVQHSRRVPLGGYAIFRLISSPSYMVSFLLV